MQMTRRSILRELWKRESATVDDLASWLGLSPMTIRHHLTILERDNLITSVSRSRPGVVGRPRLTYYLTPAGAQMFPSNTTQLAIAVLAQAKEMMTPDQLHRLMQGVAALLAAEFPRPPAQLPERRLDQIVAFLNNRGYASDWAVEDKASATYRIAMEYCPYMAVRRHHPEICSMDTMLLAQLSGAVVEFVRPEAGVRIQCSHRLKWPADAEGGRATAGNPDNLVPPGPKLDWDGSTSAAGGTSDPSPTGGYSG